MFTLVDSVKDAYNNSDNQELRAELYLSIYRKDKLSKSYIKSLKKISKLSRKIEKFEKKNNAEKNAEIDKLSKLIEKEYNNKQEIVKQAKIQKDEINDVDLISGRFISRFRQGLVLVDYFKNTYSIKSSYGRIVNRIFRKISSKSLFGILKGLLKKGNYSYYQNVIKEYPELKDERFLDTRQGGLLIESHFVLCLIQQFTSDYSEEELKILLDEIIREVGKDDVKLSIKLKELYRGGSLAEQFSEILLQIIRLSVGKGVFMNSAVKITNITLKVVIGKGMTYTQNSILRKYLARLLGSGKAAILINVLLIIPDVASLINKRDYLGLVNSIMFLYFLRINVES